MTKLEAIYRYPIKGFSPDTLNNVNLRSGYVLPFDRHWSVCFGGSDSVVDSAQPDSWVGKRNLLSLAREPRGAQLQTEFIEDSARLIIKRSGRIVAQGDLANPMGRNVIESFLDSFYINTPYKHFRIIEANEGTQGFTDFSDSHISIINLNSVKDIERVVGQEINPLRFRGNLYVRAKPWSERQWVEKSLTIGNCQLTCIHEIERCRATNVSLKKGEENMNIPQALRRGYGHIICGIYAKVSKDGGIKIGDEIKIN